MSYFKTNNKTVLNEEKEGHKLLLKKWNDNRPDFIIEILGSEYDEAKAGLK